MCKHGTCIMYLKDYANANCLPTRMRDRVWLTGMLEPGKRRIERKSAINSECSPVGDRTESAIGFSRAPRPHQHEKTIPRESARHRISSRAQRSDSARPKRLPRIPL